MTTQTPLFRVRIRGPMACFARAELKVERVSYDVITPSAAAGVLEAILWKPAIRWGVTRVHVLSPIRWGQLRRNEVNSKLSERADFTHYCADEDRAQRNTLYLRDVDYVVEARMHMTDQAGSGDNPTKFSEMFQRRLDKGQHFQQPYLGCREFVADVSSAPETWAVPDELRGPRPLGLMLHGIRHAPGATQVDANGRRVHVCKGCEPRFFEACLRDGVLEIPEDAP